MNSPILFLIFNRPDTTERVFEEIRKAQPPRLYIAADGSRANRPGEKELCEKTRAIVQKVDWDCEIKTLFRDENLGCGKAVSQAITWFFDNEPEGIILEDDILPHPDFFPYCDELLDRYRDNPEIGIIAGHNNIYGGLKADSSYCFITVPHIWGWATWKKEWDNYKYNVGDLSIIDLINSLKELGYNRPQQNYWKEKYWIMKDFLTDTWDYQWVMSLLLHKKLSVTPYKSLTKNIGFSEDATHTCNGPVEEMSLIVSPIYPITHPSNIKIDREAEYMEIYDNSRYRSTISYLKFRIKLILKKFIYRR